MSAEEHWFNGHGPWHRDVEHRLVGGVASGIAARTNIDVQYVRLAFIIAALLGGFGVAAYVIAWLLLPLASSADAMDCRSASELRRLAGTAPWPFRDRLAPGDRVMHRR